MRMRPFVTGIICVLLALSFPSIDSKLEDNFNNCTAFFFNEEPPVILGILNDSITPDDRYKVICQKYKREIRYATLYDTTNRIPVFSAYKYIGTNEFSTTVPWMIELQLEPSSAEMCKPFDKQARNQDYLINKEHSPVTLFPISHTADAKTAESTFTLTNSAPQKSGFKERVWNNVEKTTKEYMDNNCRDRNNRISAYVLTGTLPSKEKMNNRLNIPFCMWTAFCCYNSASESWDSKTYYWTKNKPINITSIKLQNLSHLQQFLNKQLKTEVELFENNCTVAASQFPPWSLQNQRIRARIKCLAMPLRSPSLVSQCLKTAHRNPSFVSQCLETAHRNPSLVSQCLRMHSTRRQRRIELIDPSEPLQSEEDIAHW